MALTRLAGVEPVHISTEAMGRERQQQNAYPRKSVRRPARARFLAATVPSRDADTCEVDYVLDETGVLTAILVRDIVSGEVLARVESSELRSLGGDEATSGLLYERRA
jgi:hypothetical protein